MFLSVCYYSAEQQQGEDQYFLHCFKILWRS
jgi:hypothetical protein